jgi:hypothetical protein
MIYPPVEGRKGDGGPGETPGGVGQGRAPDANGPAAPRPCSEARVADEQRTSGREAAGAARSDAKWPSTTPIRTWRVPCGNGSRPGSR